MSTIQAFRGPRFQRSKYLRTLHQLEHEWELWRERYALSNQRIKFENLSRALQLVREASELLDRD